MYTRIAFDLKSIVFNNTYSRSVIFLSKQFQLNNAFFPIINNVLNRILANSKIVKSGDQSNSGNPKRKRDDSEDSIETAR